MVRLLACADVHLGRRSSHLRDELAERYTPAAVWSTVIAAAVERDVDAVLVAGDLVDEENAFYEALEPVTQAARDLDAAGIPLLAVGGNHDWDVLNRLTEQTDGALRILGRGGTWEHVDLIAGEGDRVRLFGWSFPRAVVSDSPLPDFPRRALDPAAVNVGLLHADLGASSSRYCPVGRSELVGVGLDAWVLGHVHRPTRPEELGERPVVLYPGSLQGLDPGVGELGSHGPWLIECDHSGVRCTMLPMAPVVFDDCDIEVSGVRTVGDLQTRLLEFLRQCSAEWRERVAALRCLVVRLLVQGRTEVRQREIVAQLEQLRDVDQLFADVDVILDDWCVRTLPPVDEHSLADESTPLGVAARLLDELRGDGPPSAETREEILELQRRMREFTAAAYHELEGSVNERSEADCRALLAVQAERLVEALYAQKEDADEVR